MQHRACLKHARQVFASAESVQQLKVVRDQADLLRGQVKGTSQDLELLNFAAELKLQAERQIGRRLIEMKLRGGDRRSSGSREPIKLRDLGIDKNQSARWQLEASVPESTFCHFLRTAHAAGDEITSAALIRLARHLKKRPAGGEGGLLANPATEIASLTSYLPGPPPCHRRHHSAMSTNWPNWCWTQRTIIRSSPTCSSRSANGRRCDRKRAFAVPCDAIWMNWKTTWNRSAKDCGD